MTPGGVFTETHVFGQDLTEPVASNLPCSVVFKQTTIQGQIGPKPKKNPRQHFERSGGGMSFRFIQMKLKVWKLKKFNCCLVKFFLVFLSAAIVIPPLLTNRWEWVERP